jgi:hypothetical protein
MQYVRRGLGGRKVEEELCYAASEAYFEGEAFSKRDCIRARNRRGVFGGIDRRIASGYAVGVFGAADCRIGSG